MIRKAAVCGTFYPSQRKKLIEQIEKYLKGARSLFPGISPKIIIVPHAGYDYSGRTAAWAYKQIQGRKINKVILIGISHNEWLDKPAVYDNGSWYTPLGEVPVAIKLVKELMVDNQNLVSNTKAHQNEHSLEVQLPFLQMVLKSFRYFIVNKVIKNQKYFRHQLPIKWMIIRYW